MSDKTKDAVRNFLDAFNGSSDEMKHELHQEIINEHRYIQSEVISALCQVLSTVGDLNHGVDDRNKYAIELCKTLARVGRGYEPIDVEDAKVIRNFFYRNAPK